MFNWYLMVLRKYAVFSGRSRRKEFWYFMLVNTIIMLVYHLMLAQSFNFNLSFTDLFDVNTMMKVPSGSLIQIITGLYLLYGVAIIIPNIAVSIRRLHDTDRSGWWYLIIFLPLIGPIIFLIFMCMDGTQGSNRFGADPKQST